MWVHCGGRGAQAPRPRFFPLPQRSPPGGPHDDPADPRARGGPDPRRGRRADPDDDPGGGHAAVRALRLQEGLDRPDRRGRWGGPGHDLCAPRLQAGAVSGRVRAHHRGVFVARRRRARARGPGRARARPGGDPGQDALLPRAGLPVAPRRRSGGHERRAGPGSVRARRRGLFGAHHRRARRGHRGRRARRAGSRGDHGPAGLTAHRRRPGRGDRAGARTPTRPACAPSSERCCAGSPHPRVEIEAWACDPRGATGAHPPRRSGR